jgi:hypothetical protein
MRMLSFCTLALCLGFASLTHAQPTVTKYKFKGNTVHASAASGDNGCFSGFFGLTATDDITKDGSGQSATKTLEVGYFGRDLCEKLSFGGGSTTTLTVPIAGISTISFPFDFDVNYVNTDTGERFTRHVSGSVTITATGDFEKSRRTEISDTQVQRTVTRSKGNTREANISLDLKLDGVPQSMPIQSGELGTSKKGTIEITRY